jgi:excisionase family DNA binding protein
MTTTYQFQTPPIKEVHVPCHFTEKELSVYLRICRRQLYNWRMAGLIPYLKLGKAVRFRLSDVERVLETLTIGKP